MKRLGIGVFSLFLVIVLTLAVAVALARQPSVQPVSLTMSYLPGQQIAADMPCSYPPYRPGAKMYCSTWVDRHMVFIAYHVSERRITRVSYTTAGNFTIGELLLTWGTPSRVTKGYSFTYIHWEGGRSAFLTKPTTAHSRIWLIILEDEPASDTRAWRGFQSN